jgi:CBS domain-containing protein
MPNNPSRSAMYKDALKLYSQADPFRLLPKEAIAELAEWTTEIRAPRGQLVAEQAKTQIGKIFYIRKGAIELYYEQAGEKTLGARMVAGETFGGISILMNAGVAVRTAKVEDDALFYTIPADRFLALCEAHPRFREYFTEAFQQRKRNESYASILVTGQARDFLSRILPFSFLSETDLDDFVNNLSLIHHNAGTLLFVQGQSRVDYLYIIQKGAAELYYEQSGEKSLKGYLGEGDCYGGISILLNNGIAIRTLRVEEEAYLYALPKKHFLRLCSRCPSFSDYFTDTFGKRMLDRSYAEIFSRRILPKDEAVHVFNASVSRLMNRDILSCSQHVPVQQAATLMSRRKCSSIFVQDDEGRHIGIVTDTDLRNRVIAQGLETNIPISAIMSSPLSMVPEQLSVFEAMLEMMQKKLKHLAVQDSKGRVIGSITSRDLLAAQGQSPLFIVREITSAVSREELRAQQARIPGLVQNLISSGARAENVTRLIATVSDAILQRLIEIALEQNGPPPAPFVFMIMGSEGRREQTLKTDQDNAIVFQDVPDERLPAVKQYFLDFGETICTWLDEIGYAFCEGGVMAMNPSWCQPLSAWRNKFSEWIHTAEAEDLLHSSIFFDFRGAYGDFGLIDQLRRHLFDALQGWSGFFRHLTENALHFKPPLGFFRNFVVESKGEHRNALDIKQAMLPVVDFTRIHALKNGIEETNTMDRLYQLHERGHLSSKDYTDITRSYSFMMQLRFMRQITAIIEENRKPDNYINPKKLSRIEQTMLKEIFKRVEDFQTKMSFEFTGQ